MTIYYIGDSTVAVNKIHTYPQTGMAQALPLYLKEEVQVVSLAKNGRSTKSFLDEGLFVPAPPCCKRPHWNEKRGARMSARPSFYSASKMSNISRAA